MIPTTARNGVRLRQTAATDRVAALFDDVGQRAITGPATEALAGAREGLWQMHNNPGVAFLCGPMALKNLLLARGTPADETAFLDAYRSPQGDVTLAEVVRLADRAQLKYRLVKRQPGDPIPIPSIVHWRVSHFAALVGADGDRLHLKDPTFGTDLWISRDALDAEASGYFLVPREQTPGKPWQTVSRAETTTYDKLDVASRTDRLGRTTTYTHDAVRNLTAVTDPAGRTTRYGYYADGVLKTLTDPNGNVTTFERDIQGRPTARVYADGSRETYAYEPATGRLKSRTDPLGQRTD